MIEICAVGGYNEVGKNMTAVKVDEHVIILDMGIHVDNYIGFTKEEDVVGVSASRLREAGVIADDTVIEKWRDNVSLIAISHAHLDHIGAVPFNAGRYDAPILVTPYAGAVVRAIAADEEIKLKNKLEVMQPNSTYKISPDLKVEMIGVTHSIPETVFLALHTKYGIVIYATDFKFDDSPVVGKKINTRRLEEIGKSGKVIAVIMECLRAGEAVKTPSESVAREMLREVLLGTHAEGKLIVVTTFSSHIARLKSILEFGKKLNRKVVFLGRSLAKYTSAAEEVGIAKFSNEVEIVKYGNKVKKYLRKMAKADAGKYLLVVTGHQGEPKSTLSKMIGEYNFKFSNEDVIIFSCNVIPSPVNIENRKKLEAKLKDKGLRIFKDIHVSGHASREDLRELINILKPEHIIPVHGEAEKAAALVSLAKEKGYKLGKNVHLMSNGGFLKLG
ncbi:MAG TPA: RNase J family beta-CASP ribonuclease [Candidatus Nanoarchaeia archaeon]|nr:RNase J family beta-CASP ribonuclease [Candidatus Nanoarchaeia archaeon]